MMLRRTGRTSVLLSGAIAAAIALRWPAIAHADVPIEQIEAYGDPTDSSPTEYAAINFNGSSTVTVSGGVYNGITFNAINGTATEAQFASDLLVRASASDEFADFGSDSGRDFALAPRNRFIHEGLEATTEEALLPITEGARTNASGQVDLLE